MGTGLFTIPNDEYRQKKDWVSNSELGLFQVAPVIYKHRIIDGNRSSFSRALSEGSAVHAAVLEPQEFEKDYVSLPAMDMRLKANKDHKAMLQAANPAATLLAFEDYSRIIALARHVHEHPVAGPLIRLCDQIEQSFFWIDPDLGVQCKGRADALCLEQGIIVDLKTTKSAASFSRSIADYGYHRQAAFYIDGLTLSTGRRDWTWYWAIVEPEAPFLMKVIQAKASDIEVGRREYKKLLQIYKDCKERNEYPGLDESIDTTTGLPGWYLERANSGDIIELGQGGT